MALIIWWLTLKEEYVYHNALMALKSSIKTIISAENAISHVQINNALISTMSMHALNAKIQTYISTMANVYLLINAHPLRHNYQMQAIA